MWLSVFAAQPPNYNNFLSTSNTPTAPTNYGLSCTFPPFFSPVNFRYVSPKVSSATTHRQPNFLCNPNNHHADQISTKHFLSILFSFFLYDRLFLIQLRHTNHSATTNQQQLLQPPPQSIFAAPTTPLQHFWRIPFSIYLPFPLPIWFLSFLLPTSTCLNFHSLTQQH